MGNYLENAIVTPAEAGVYPVIILSFLAEGARPRRAVEMLSENNKSLYCHSVLDMESRGGDEVTWILAPVSSLVPYWIRERYKLRQNDIFGHLLTL